MPKPKKGPRLGGSPSHQRKILANLAASLIQEERITTTETRAKQLRPYVEKMVTKARPVPLELVVVPTFYDQRTRASRDSLAVLRRDFAANLWPGVIPVDTRFRDASRAGLAPALFDPRTHGVQAYAQQLEELVRHADNTTVGAAR